MAAAMSPRSAAASPKAWSGGYPTTPAKIADIAKGTVKYWEIDRPGRASQQSSTIASSPRTNVSERGGLFSDQRVMKRPVSASAIEDINMAGVPSGRCAQGEGGKRVYRDGLTFSSRVVLGPHDEWTVQEQPLKERFYSSLHGQAAGGGGGSFLRERHTEGIRPFSAPRPPRLFRQEHCEPPLRVQRSGNSPASNMVKEVCHGAAGVTSERQRTDQKEMLCPAPGYRVRRQPPTGFDENAAGVRSGKDVATGKARRAAEVPRRDGVGQIVFNGMEY